MQRALASTVPKRRPVLRLLHQHHRRPGHARRGVRRSARLQHRAQPDRGRDHLLRRRRRHDRRHLGRVVRPSDGAGSASRTAVATVFGGASSASARSCATRSRATCPPPATRATIRLRATRLVARRDALAPAFRRHRPGPRDRAPRAGSRPPARRCRACRLTAGSLPHPPLAPRHAETCPRNLADRRTAQPAATVQGGIDGSSTRRRGRPRGAATTSSARRSSTYPRHEERHDHRRRRSSARTSTASPPTTGTARPALGDRRRAGRAGAGHGSGCGARGRRRAAAARHPDPREGHHRHAGPAHHRRLASSSTGTARRATPGSSRSSARRERSSSARRTCRSSPTTATSARARYGQVWNAFDPSRSSIGSSGGSAVAVASSFAAAALGTQTGDSLWGPSSAASLSSLRGTDGMQSSDGIMPLTLLKDYAGFIAQSLPDLALLLNATAIGNPPTRSTTSPTASVRPTGRRASARTRCRARSSACRPARVRRPVRRPPARATRCARSSRTSRRPARRSRRSPTRRTRRRRRRPATAATRAGCRGSTATRTTRTPRSAQIIRSPLRIPQFRNTNPYTGTGRDDGRGDQGASRRSGPTYRASLAVVDGLPGRRRGGLPGPAVGHPPQRLDPAELRPPGSAVVRVGRADGDLPGGRQRPRPADQPAARGQAFSDPQLLGYAYAFEAKAHGHVESALTPALPFATATTGGVGGTVPATLSLTLGTPATFGAFVPGADRDYSATTAATVVSTAGRRDAQRRRPLGDGHRSPGQRHVLAALAAAGRRLAASRRGQDLRRPGVQRRRDDPRSRNTSAPPTPYARAPTRKPSHSPCPPPTRSRASARVRRLVRGVHAHEHLVALRAGGGVLRVAVAAGARPRRLRLAGTQEGRDGALDRRAGDGALVSRTS